ncbi:MAG TPA: hypothetical protein VH186_30990 [Chloroflexia bacterium]|nr:hypothetical protein [Chloroflexia bacterium]
MFSKLAFTKQRLAGLALVFMVGLLLAACGDNTQAPATNNPAAVVSTASTGVIVASPAAGNSATTNASSSQQPVKAAVGATAPDFTAKDVNNQPLQLQALRGKAVIINYWAVY